MINYIDIQGYDTSADLRVSVDGMTLTVEMSYFINGLTFIQRQGDKLRESVVLTSDPELPKRCTFYLLDKPKYDPVEEPRAWSNWVKDPETGEPKLESGVDYVTVNRLIKNEGEFLLVTNTSGYSEQDLPPADTTLLMMFAQFTIPPGLSETIETLVVPRTTETGEVVLEEVTIKHGLDQVEDFEVRRII